MQERSGAAGRRRARVVGGLGLLAAGASLAIGARGAAAAPAQQPSLAFVQPAREVIATRFVFGPDSFLQLDLGLWLAARHGPVEVRLRRTSYSRPLVATLVRGGLRRTLPPTTTNGWSGFSRLATITWRTDDGQELGTQYADFCPNDQRVRRRPVGTATSAYPPNGCFASPFSKSSIWGVDEGWASALSVPPPSFDLPDGHYVAEVALRDRVAALLGVPKRARTARVGVTVRTFTDGGGGVGEARATRPAWPARPSAGTPRAAASPHRQAPPRRLAPPAPDTLPDLAALPSWGISTSVEEGRDYLNFGATTYNAGPGPMVVEGFRQPDRELMDAYQAFYRDGRAVAYRRIGSMEYDPRVGHEHWHFRDFSAYDLLDASRRKVQRSGKEAWCLAPTDAIDLLAPNAAMNPGNGDLATACGFAGALWIREVLASGWGDTYSQARPGQSFDITDLPNGTYFIRITANPDGRIRERTARNNVALRRIVLGGSAGARTVTVPPVGLVDSEAGLGLGAG